MKNFCRFLTLIVLAAFTASCNSTDEPIEKAPIKVLDGNVALEDMEFGMYYGNIGRDGLGVYRVVLSNAICFRDGYGAPYLDSEGDMLVLEFKAPMQDSDAPIMIPEEEYKVGSAQSDTHTINLSNSYVKRLVGSMQYHYELVSGSFVVGRTSEGGYDIITKDLVIAKGDEQEMIQYSYNGAIRFEDWNKVAVTLQDIKDDIIDMPFTDVSAVYYGNLFGYGTGNYVVTLATDGFMEDESGTLPGVAVVLNMFGEIQSKDKVILLEEGTYTVYPQFNYKEFSMLFGLNMDGMPFGTYLAQVDNKKTQSLEFIGIGTVEVSRETAEGYNDIYTLKYDLETPKRKVQGTWVGQLDFVNAATDDGRVPLSNLDDDVACDMSKVERGHMAHVETLKTTYNPVSIAEAWQLWLQPRMWTDEEMELPFEERVQAWDPNGDIMILEFVVPLRTRGDIAPEKNKEYKYTIQPNLSMEDPLYKVSVSKMGRPYDDIFYQPNWKDYPYMTGVDARRGFTWDGGYRGNWYLHYIPGTWQNMDEMAPAVKGTVTVTRTSDYVEFSDGREANFNIVWDLYDDAEASYNITGEWSGPITLANESAGDEGGDKIEFE